MTKQHRHWLSMHFKSVFLLLLLSGTLLFSYAKEDVEVLAKNVDKKGTLVHAKEDVVLYSDKYFITADEAYYDYESSDVELFGNITMMQGGSLSTRSGYAKINLQEDKGKFSPMFAYDDDSKIWMKCEDASFNPQSYLTKKSIVSSCNVQDPDWKISFSSGEYEREEQFMHLYNSVFYAGDIPMFYLPYFAFPTDKTRRSGLLRPYVGYGSSEGIYYQQAIYFAPQKSWDFQLSPQIRTKRGVGASGLLRFADSAHSYGEILFGKFQEKTEYFEENNLKNKEHWGYSIEYDRSELFSHLFDENTQDGLLLDFNYLNDIDYFNTLDNEDKSYDKLVKSKLNYFISNDKNYLGVYAKYYIDTSKVDNDTTLQEVPTLHYHHFSDTLFNSNIYYNIDYQGTNYTRDEGVTAKLNEISVPLTLYLPLFGDYLHLKATQNIYLSKTYYDNADLIKDTGTYLKNYHRLSLYTELSKPYESFFHTFYLGADYTIPSSSKEKGYFASFVPINEEEENLALTLVEYFYDKEGNKKISHTMKQSLFFSDYKYKYGDLSNDLRFYFSKDISLSNLLSYSHEHSRVSRFQTSLKWDTGEYDLSFIHTYKRDVNGDKTNYLTTKIDTEYIKNYNFFASANYDIKEDYFKSWQVGVKMKRKCWDYRLTYREDRTPKLTSSGSDSVNRKGVYLLFNLYPLGTIDYDFVQESEVSSE